MLNVLIFSIFIATPGCLKWIYDTSSNDTLSTEPFRRKSFLSNCHFDEFPLRRNSFRRILSTNYSMLTRPFIVSADHLDCEATDTGEGYQSEADCCFYEGARGGDERVKQ